MPINFCPGCENILIPKKKEGEIFLFCSKCGFFEEIEKALKSIEKIEGKKVRGEGVNKNESGFATYENICKKCGHDKAEVMDLGVQYSDEDNLIFLRCGKCGFSERIGRKTS